MRKKLNKIRREKILFQ